MGYADDSADCAHWEAAAGKVASSFWSEGRTRGEEAKKHNVFYVMWQHKKMHPVSRFLFFSCNNALTFRNTRAAFSRGDSARCECEAEFRKAKSLERCERMQKLAKTKRIKRGKALFCVQSGVSV